MKRIGLYGGTFNPFHFGHLNLAIEMLEKHRLDHIYFCPAVLNPHKLDSQPIPSEHRLAMLKLALADLPQLSVIENELQRAPPSYTIDTINELFEEETLQDAHLFLIIGADALPRLAQWHRIDEIIKRAHLLVGVRKFETVDENVFFQDSALKQAIQQGMTLTRIIQTSSTEIRERLRQNKYCGHLVPAKVLDYIYTNHLY